MNLTHLIRNRVPIMLRAAGLQPPHGGARVRAEVWGYRAGELRLLSTGTNGMHSVAPHLVPRDELKVGICAEAHALNGLSMWDTYGSTDTIIVVRSKKIRRGGPSVNGNAKPCEHCMAALNRSSVKAVVYTNGDTFEVELI